MHSLTFYFAASFFTPSLIIIEIPKEHYYPPLIHTIAASTRRTRNYTPMRQYLHNFSQLTYKLREIIFKKGVIFAQINNPG